MWQVLDCQQPSLVLIAFDCRIWSLLNNLNARLLGGGLCGRSLLSGGTDQAALRAGTSTAS